MVSKIFYENIDGIHRLVSGIDDNSYPNGLNNEVSCPTSKQVYPREKFIKAIREDKIAYCDKSGGPIKPNIRFTGEEIPQEYFEA